MAYLVGVDHDWLNGGILGHETVVVVVIFSPPPLPPFKVGEVVWVLLGCGESTSGGRVPNPNCWTRFDV